jgi:hypothetical protein
MKRFALSLPITAAFLFMTASPAPSQTLTKIYVSEAGIVLGAIFLFDPGLPAVAFVNGGGVLVWINVEIPGAIVEIHTNGTVQLVERTSPGNIAYADGRIRRIGEAAFEYEDGRIRRIGNLKMDYWLWRIRQIGDLPIVIEDGFLRELGGVRFEYENARLRKIDDLLFTYETGRVVRIGEVRFEYDTGTLKKVTGTLSEVTIHISSIVEFRQPFRR